MTAGRSSMAGQSTRDGLSTAEVELRRRAGRGNAMARRSSRSIWAIVRANVLTRFNAIIGVLLAVVLVFGPPQDGLFGLVIVVNSAVGIVQELRAKRVLDALAVLERAPVRVRRSGTEMSVPPEELVEGDVILLGTGAKVPVDGEVVDADGLEVDESLLTGEADPVVKRAGDQVLSGSFVVAGAGRFVAARVGQHAYTNQLTAQARRFDLAHSTLMAGINQLLRILTWVIVPVGVLLVASQPRTRSYWPCWSGWLGCRTRSCPATSPSSVPSRSASRGSSSPSLRTANASGPDSSHESCVWPYRLGWSAAWPRSPPTDSPASTPPATRRPTAARQP